MPLFFPGKTRCKICGQVIQINDEHVSFPPFVSNKLDPLSFFNDAIFHKHCFLEHPLSDKVMERLEFRNGYMKNKNYHVCRVCNKRIMHPDDYFTLIDFTENPDDPLYKYNFYEFHRAHLHQWPEINLLISLIKDLKNKETWDDYTLNWLLKEIEKILSENND